MMNEHRGWFARGVAWMVRRNPTYLLSAALMAVGARLFLVGPADVAGDVKLILFTLAALQIYEWLVGGILLFLHWHRRSPEDQPSLLVVVALFWTGPMAATIEMTAWRPALGSCLAAGACLIAIGELRLVSHSLRLRLSAAGQVAACASVVLVAATGPLLTVPVVESGINELILYGAWWALAGIVLVGAAAVGSYRRRWSQPLDAGVSIELRRELIFLAMTFAAAALHLVAINHGFFCHAAAFYCAPLIVAVSVVAMAFLSLGAGPDRWLLGAYGLLPGVAVLLTLQPFDPEVPVVLLPGWLGDPTLTVALAAAGAWWFGYARHRTVVLLHAGNAALGLAAYRTVGLLAVEGAVTSWPLTQVARSNGLAVAMLYATAIYLAVVACIRRSRLEGLAALAVHLPAVGLLVWGKTPADELVIWLLAGWSVLFGLHLAFRRPHLSVRLVPIVFLVIAPWTLESAPELWWLAAGHAAFLILALLVVGWIRRWTRYRSAALVLLGVHLIALAERWTVQGSNPTAELLVGAGFALAASGALISWHKHRLLEAIDRRDDPSCPDEQTSC
ncbi:MAG: hypothetical protein GY778_00765 [bacterium]|nr:hypothetical protein [bacterium]